MDDILVTKRPMIGLDSWRDKGEYRSRSMPSL